MIGMTEKIIDKIGDRVKLFCFLIRDGESKFLFEIHYQFHQVERVRTDIGRERRRIAQGIMVDSQACRDVFVYSIPKWRHKLEIVTRDTRGSRAEP